MEAIETSFVAIEMATSEDIEDQISPNDSGKENGEIIEISNSPKKENSIELKDDSKRNSIGLKTLSEMNGKDNFIIDLDSGIIKPKKLTGPELLFQKYLKTQAKPKQLHKDTVCMNFLTVENGKLENQKIEMKLEKEIELDHLRPGFSHEKLKENLKNQILQQRLEKLKQRFYKSEQAELEPEDKHVDHFPNNIEEIKIEKNGQNEDDTSDEEWNEENEEVSDEEAEEEETNQKKKKKNDASKFLDEEAVDEDNEEENDDEEASSSESESSDEEIAVTQKKGRILKAFEDSDDEDSKVANLKAQQQESNKIAEENDKINDNQMELTETNETNVPKSSTELKCSEDLFNSQATDFTFNEPSVSEEINIDDLFDPKSQANNEDDLLDLCSGQFAATQSQIVLTNNDFNFTQKNLDNQDDFKTQVPEIENCQKIDENCLENDDSFVIDVIPEKDEIDVELPVEAKIVESSNEIEISETEPKKNLKKILDSTDDEIESENQVEKRKIKRRKKKKDRVKKLDMSDDSGSEKDAIDTDLPEGNDSVEEEQEIVENEVYVDYDSEENEVQVKLSKKDHLKAAKGYFENEAELSESDWNSADENEIGLDKYDSDLADDDEFDQDKLREEIGRIHARKIMDEDIKKVKKIQDLLFEDEENDGIGRDRKFKWKNQTEGFTMEDENARDADDIENAEHEDENEIMWRRMRHERETLINEQSQKTGENENSILLLDQSSQTVTTASTSALVKRKFQIIKTNSVSGLNISTENNKLDSPFLIKSGTKKFTSSSFLSRDEKTLTRIASFISTKQTDDEVTNLSSHGGNSMSFAHIEKKEDSKKRKSDGSNQQDSNKKRKVENQKFLLDQLK